MVYNKHTHGARSNNNKKEGGQMRRKGHGPKEPSPRQHSGVKGKGPGQLTDDEEVWGTARDSAASW